MNIAPQKPRVPMPWLSAPRCESPIEDAMAIALGLALQGVKIRKQVQFDNYRVDFLVGQNLGSPSVVIECDGREFHDATGGQNQRDRIRDRYLQGIGLAVLRFSGTEIKHRARACADEVAAVYRNRVQQHSSGAA